MTELGPTQPQLVYDLIIGTNNVGGRGSKGPYHKKCNNASKKKFDDFGQKIGQFSLFKTTVSILLSLVIIIKKP